MRTQIYRSYVEDHDTGVVRLGTFGCPGVARTTFLTQGKRDQPTLIDDAREYVLFCERRRTK